MLSGRHLVVKATGKPIAIQSYACPPTEAAVDLHQRHAIPPHPGLGDYWLFDLAAKSFAAVGGDAPPASLMYAAFSPDGSRIAYVRANDLYVEPSAGDAPPRQLTRDGTT